MLTNIIFVSCIGLCLSIYAFFIEKKIKRDESYSPICDISNRISCSKPFQSSYTKIFGISNTLTGMAYYVSILILAALNMNFLLLIITTAGLIISIGLAYILYTKIKSFCLICNTIYLINGILLILAYKNFI